jgi:hypothetical protein
VPGSQPPFNAGLAKLHAVGGPAPCRIDWARTASAGGVRQHCPASTSRPQRQVGQAKRGGGAHPQQKRTARRTGYSLVCHAQAPAGALVLQAATRDRSNAQPLPVDAAEAPALPRLPVSDSQRDSLVRPLGGGSKKNVKSAFRTDGLAWKHRRKSVKCRQPVHPSSGVIDLCVAYLTHDLLSGFYGQRCCDLNPTEGGDRATTGAAVGRGTAYIIHQLFGTMGNMNSGNLVSAAAGSPSSELSRSRESGGPAPPRICTGQFQSVSWVYRYRGGGGSGQRKPTPGLHPPRRSRSVRPAPGTYKTRQGHPGNGSLYVYAFDMVTDSCRWFAAR